MGVAKRRWAVPVVALLTILSMGYLAVLAADHSQILDILRGSRARIRDLRCRAHIEVVQDTLLCTAGTFDVLYTLKLPGQARVEVLSQRVYLLRDEDLIVHNAMRGMTKLDLTQLKDAPLKVTKLPSELPPIGSYVCSLSKLFRFDALPLQVTGTELCEGKNCRTVEMVLPEPIRPLEPHQITKYRWWVDVGRQAIVRSEAYSQDDELVVRVEHKDFQPVGGDRWLAMRTVSIVKPGTAHLRVRHDAELAETSMPIRGYHVETRFRWFQDYSVRLPTQRTYADPDGNLICTIQFSDYLFNQGLHDLELRSWRH